ncbi:hypothetical protein LTR95_008551 [Oleoguttula sp. CCFEE 5521]
MYASKLTARSARALRSSAPAARRYASDVSAPSGGNHITAGIIGGIVGAGAIGGFAYYHYRSSGIATAADTANQIKSYVDSTTEKLKVQFKEKTPEPSEALSALKGFAQQYTMFIPGAKPYVDSTFKDLETVRAKHGPEVDNIVSEAYTELRDASSNGLTLTTLTAAWGVLQKHLHKLSSLAADAGQDILNNHPELKEKMGGSFEQLQSLGDRLGPEAKKQVDETWKQVQELTQQGLNFGSVQKVREIVEQKMQEISKIGDKLWQEGLEQAKPMLDKQPELKKLIEENADVLKKGNVGEALQRLQKAVQSGDFGDLEKYIDGAKNKAKQYAPSGLNNLLDNIPQGSKILPELQRLKAVAENNSDEAQNLVKETINEVLKVLENKKDKIEELVKKGGK